MGVRTRLTRHLLLAVACCFVPGVLGLHYESFPDKAVSGLTVMATSTLARSSVASECAQVCENHAPGTCSAFSVNGNTCQLYDTSYIKNSLTDAPGSTVYTLTERVLAAGALQILQESNVGATNLFPEMPLPSPGHVYKWKWQSKQPGEVVLGVWRPLPGTVFRLVGKTRMTVTSAQTMMIRTYYLTQQERFEVQKGDLVGFYYDTSNQARISIESQPSGEPGITDDDLQRWYHCGSTSGFTVGDVMEGCYLEGINKKRLPVLAAYVA